MQIDLKNINVIHNAVDHRFEVHIAGKVAVSNYDLQGNTISFYHVGVPPELENQGIGSLLAQTGLEYAREQSYKVVAACPFVAAHVQRHPEYDDLLK
jgi:predicted GNAT family acetyltransferase